MEFLGYLPLSFQYSDVWIQLCYSIMHLIHQWTAWVKALNQNMHRAYRAAVQIVVNNNTTRILQYILIRCLIVDKLLAHNLDKEGSDHLDLFDEFLI